MTSQTGTDTTTTFQDFMNRCHDAHAEQTKGRPEPFLELWSHTSDATLMAAVGGYHIGFDNISTVLTEVSRTLSFDTVDYANLATQIDGELAYTVEIERMTRQEEGNTEEMAIRATQVYRFADGQWRIVHRHGDVLSPIAVKW